MLERDPQTNISQVDTNDCYPSIDLQARMNDPRSQCRQKQYFDKRKNMRPSSIEIGDSALVRDDFKRKLSTPFKTNPHNVTDKQGTMITASADHHKSTRNSSHFKSVSFPLNQSTDVHYEDEEDILPPSSESPESVSFTRITSTNSEYIFIAHGQCRPCACSIAPNNVVTQQTMLFGPYTSSFEAVFVQG